jgi:hypothetical protein
LCPSGIQRGHRPGHVRRVSSRILRGLRDREIETYHSRSLYMMVKKTCRKRLTAFISTANRYNQASPDIMMAVD